MASTHNFPRWSLILALGVVGLVGIGAYDLPDLGEPARVDFPVAKERQIGAEIMNEIRQDPSYVDDTEVNAYIQRLGEDLAALAPSGSFPLTFFVLEDPTFNAFALPGGYVGVHSGTVLATQSEAELAGVVAHEIGHVRRQHIARMVGNQREALATNLLGMAAALLAGARGQGDAAIASMMTSGALNAEKSLAYSRNFEREADETGLQILQRAGKNPQAMADVFVRMDSTLNDSGAIPAYFRTHPLNTDRIAAIEDRITLMPVSTTYHPSLPEFELVRAKLWILQNGKNNALAKFESEVEKSKDFSARAALYGLTETLLQLGRIHDARAKLALLQKNNLVSPMIDGIAARVAIAAGMKKEGEEILRASHETYPDYRPITFSLLDLLYDQKSYQYVINLARSDMRSHGATAKLWDYQAQAWAALSHQFNQHLALAESYLLRHQLQEALEQFSIAEKASDATDQERTTVQARLKELRERIDQRNRDR